MQIDNQELNEIQGEYDLTGVSIHFSGADLTGNVSVEELSCKLYLKFAGGRLVICRNFAGISDLQIDPSVIENMGDWVIEHYFKDDPQSMSADGIKTLKELVIDLALRRLEKAPFEVDRYIPEFYGRNILLERRCCDETVQIELPASK